MASEDFKNETCDSILDTVKTIYNEESERFKQVEAKTNITIAFSGVLFAAYLTYLERFNTQVEDVSYLIYTFTFKLAVLILIVIGIVFFLKSIKTDEYSQPSLQEIVSYEFARESESSAKLDISATYKEAIDQNREKIERKLNYYNKGLYFLTIGLFVFLVHFLIEEVIKYAI